MQKVRLTVRQAEALADAVKKGSVTAWPWSRWDATCKSLVQKGLFVQTGFDRWCYEFQATEEGQKRAKELTRS